MLELGACYTFSSALASNYYSISCSYFMLYFIIVDNTFTLYGLLTPHFIYFSLSPHSELECASSVSGAAYCISLPGISVVIQIQPWTLEVETLNHVFSISPHSELECALSVSGAVYCISLPGISVVIKVQPWTLERWRF